MKSQKIRFTRLVVFLVIAGLSAQWKCLTSPVSAKKNEGVKVLSRARIGGYIEETTYIPTGPFAHHIAVTNGYEILGIPVNANADKSVKRIFNSIDVGYRVPPKGMAYIETEGTFAFVEGASPTKLFVADEHGKALPPRTIEYLPGQPLDFLHNEGLVYLPPSSPHFPDRLLMIANRFPDDPPFINATIEVLRRDGTVEAQIILPPSLRENYLTGLGRRGTDQLLVGLNNELWTIDFNGTVVSGPVITPANYVEGVEQLPDGRIVISSNERLYFYDQNLSRLPQDDRDLGIGLGLLVTSGITWNSDINQLVLAANFESTGNYFEPQMLAAIPTSLKSYTPLFQTDPLIRDRMVQGIEFLPDEHLTAMLLWRFAPAPPGQIALYDAGGQEVDRIPTPGSPSTMTFIPQTNQFGITLRGSSVDHKIFVLSRTGAVVRQIDLLAKVGMNRIDALTSFDPEHPSGGKFLVFGSRDLDNSRAVVVDFQGNLLSEFNVFDALGMIGSSDLTTITTGPLAGAFSVSDALNHEIVVFRLND